MEPNLDFDRYTRTASVEVIPEGLATTYVVLAMVAVRVGLHVGTTQALDRLAAARVPTDVGALVVERLTSVLRDTTQQVGIGASVVLAVAGVAAVLAAGRRERRTAPPGASPDGAVPT